MILNKFYYVSPLSESFLEKFLLQWQTFIERTDIKKFMSNKYVVFYAVSSNLDERYQNFKPSFKDRTERRSLDAIYPAPAVDFYTDDYIALQINSYLDSRSMGKHNRF